MVEREELQADFRHLAETVRQSLCEALEALRNRDRRKAFNVVLINNRLREIESKIDRNCVSFLVTAGEQTGFVYWASKLAGDVERIGKHAQSIAQEAISLSDGTPHPVVVDIAAMGERALGLYDDALMAFFDSRPVPEIPTEELREAARVAYGKLTSENIGSTAQAARVYSLLNVLNRVERTIDRITSLCRYARKMQGSGLPGVEGAAHTLADEIQKQ